MNLCWRIVCLWTAAVAAFGQPAPFRPDRGFRPTGSYAASELDSVNETSGNVTWRLPLAALPPGRNGHTFSLDLVYNSALYTLRPEQLPKDRVTGYTGPDTHVSVMALSQSDLQAAGGWRYSYRYSLEDDQAACTEATGICYRLTLTLPDGSSHPLWLNVSGTYNQANGFSQYNFGGLRTDGSNPAQLAPPLTYYTTDGTYIRVMVDSRPGWDYWQATFPDGRYVKGPIAGGYLKEADFICDRNNNCTQIVNQSTESGPETHILDGFGRGIVLKHGANFTSVDTGSDTVLSYGYDSEASVLPSVLDSSKRLETTVTWSKIVAGGANRQTPITYRCASATDNAEYTCTHSMSFKAVTEVKLPHKSNLFRYSFEYADDSAPAGQQGQGQIRRVSLPSATASATVEYTWHRPNGSQALTTREAVDNPVATKTLKWTNGVPEAAQRNWAYTFTDTSSEIRNPDGGVTTNQFGSRTGPLWMASLIHRTDSPNGTT